MNALPADRLNQVLKRFEFIEARMSAGPDSETYVKLASEYSELQDLVAEVRALRAAEAERDGLRAMLDDKATDREMRELDELELP